MLSVCIASLLFLFALPSDATVSAPSMLWAYGGPCFNSWCHRGWYSSPAITKIGDAPVVVGGFYGFSAVYGDGTTAWTNDFTNGQSRMWPGIVVADINGDGVEELVTAHGSGHVGVWKVSDGSAWSSSWPKTIGTNEWRSLAVGDLDHDGKLEIVLGKAVADNLNVWVLQNNGSVRSGWPRGGVSQNDGYSWGVYNDNIGLTNLDGDADLEVVVPSDVSYVCAYNEDGTPVGVGATGGPADQNTWGRVQFATDKKFEELGYVDCAGFPAEDPSRTNFADGPVAIADVDGDGVEELVFVGRTYQFCPDGAERTTHNGVYIMNKDRTRWTSANYDWTVVPDSTNSELGNCLSSDYSVIESAHYNPVVADLDGDGEKEIIFSSYDGKIHVFSLDKTEHYNWPHVVGTPEQKRFASEPVVVDFDNDGKAEIVVSVWGAVGSKFWGHFLILDWQGNVLHTVDFPEPKACQIDSVNCGGIDWAGALAAPTVGNINGDADMEITWVTTSSGIVSYTVPNSANARLLWATGRGNQWRSGFAASQVSENPIRNGPNFLRLAEDETFTVSTDLECDEDVINQVVVLMTTSINNYLREQGDSAVILFEGQCSNRGQSVTLTGSLASGSTDLTTEELEEYGNSALEGPIADDINDNNDDGLSGGAIAGIVIGVIAFFVIVAIIFYLVATNRSQGMEKI